MKAEADVKLPPWRAGRVVCVPAIGSYPGKALF